MVRAEVLFDPSVCACVPTFHFFPPPHPLLSTPLMNLCRPRCSCARLIPALVISRCNEKEATVTLQDKRLKDDFLLGARRLQIVKFI